MKTIITGLLSKAYNIDAGKIAELIKDGEMSEDEQKEALKKILEIDKNRIQSVTETATKNVNTKEFIEQGYNKAKGEVLTKFEQGLKSKFGLETDKTGQDLIDFIVSEKAEKGGSGELTEDAIKRSKFYQDLESNAKTQVKTLKDEYEEKIKSINDGYLYEKTFSDVSQKALTIFNGLNPILPTSKTVADNQVKIFVDSLKGFKFDKQDDRIVVMDAEGKVVQDAHGNSRSFEDIIKEQASGLFEFKANNGGSGAGNGNGEGGQGGGSGSHAIPKTFEDLEKVMGDASISIEDRSNIMVEYEKAQKGI